MPTQRASAKVSKGIKRQRLRLKQSLKYLRSLCVGNNMRIRLTLVSIILISVTTTSAREWKSTDGARSFQGQLVDYRPPLVTVVKSDGQRIIFNENLLSQKDKLYCSLANRVIGSSFPKIPYQVFQVLDYGILCRELPDQNPYNSNEIMFIWGSFKQTVAEGQNFRTNIYWAGSYTYETVKKEEHTIRSFALDLDEAVAIWEYRLSPKKNRDESDHRTRKLTNESMSSSGTGFAITGSGYIVTNAHVIEGAKTIRVSIGDKLTRAKLVTSDPSNDLAILKIEAATQPLALGLSESVKLGDEITVGGFPNPDIQGTSLKLTRGVISGMRGMRDDVRHFQIDATVQPGNSGGPLLTAKGFVAGIVNARLNDSAVALATGALPQNVNYAIKIDYLVPLIRSVDGLLESVKATSPRSETSLGELLQQSAYLIICEIQPQ